jgi:hypothetical protein
MMTCAVTKEPVHYTVNVVPDMTTRVKMLCVPSVLKMIAVPERRLANLSKLAAVLDGLQLLTELWIA